MDPAALLPQVDVDEPVSVYTGLLNDAAEHLLVHVWAAAGDDDSVQLHGT